MFSDKHIKKSNLGKIGEKLAENFLLNKGYKIIAKNYRKKFGEIDIIAKNNDDILIFFEVKSLKVDNICINGFYPEDNLTKSKYHKLLKIGQFFALKYPWLIKEEKGWQIDLIAISFFKDNKAKIRHYRNIFR